MPILWVISMHCCGPGVGPRRTLYNVRMPLKDCSHGDELVLGGSKVLGDDIGISHEGEVGDSHLRRRYQCRMTAVSYAAEASLNKPTNGCNSIFLAYTSLSLTLGTIVSRLKDHGRRLGWSSRLPNMS